MANYAVEAQLLTPYLPAGTELDFWQDTCYVSLVGFMFLNTAVKGIRIPFHINFEEVNLRFYVRYREQGEWKRGVVFIKEIVPRHALSFIANTLYSEKYETLPMAHQWLSATDSQTITYCWKKKGRWHSFEANTQLSLSDMESGSEAEFITEHFWGYTKVSDNSTSEYQVAHPRWQLYPLNNYSVNVDFGHNYGEAFSVLNTQQPLSVFLAEGSEITVHHGRRL